MLRWLLVFVLTAIVLAAFGAGSEGSAANLAVTIAYALGALAVVVFAGYLFEKGSA